MNAKIGFFLLLGVCSSAACSGAEPRPAEERVASTSSAIISTDGRYQMVTGARSTDSTYNAMESETSISISPISGTNNAVAMVTYNDDSNNGTNLTFTNTTRTIKSGASLMGWSYVVYDTTQSFNNVAAWTYGGKVAVPSGWATLWGDPSSTAVPGTSYVLISNLAMPSSKYTGPISGLVGANNMGGACLALSSDNGRTFAFKQCLQNTAVQANGDFYDGSTMAATNDGRVYVAYNDIDTTSIDVWSAPSATGTFSRIANPFPGMTAILHPRLRRLNNVILIAAGMQNASTGNIDLYMNYLSGSGWATPSLIASNIAVEEDLNVVGSFIGANNQTWRRAGMFSFDAGRVSRNGNDGIRVAVTVPDSFHGLQVQVYACTTSNGAFTCIRTPEWDAPTTGTNFSPIVKATATSGAPGDPTWALVYEQVYGGDLVESNGYFLDVQSNGTRQAVQAGTPPNNAAGTGEKPWWPQGPCPTAQVDTNNASNTYEGDYDDLQVASESWNPDGTIHPYFFATETNTRIPADLSGTGSEIRCTTQQQFSSAPQHVAVNMFALAP